MFEDWKEAARKFCDISDICADDSISAHFSGFCLAVYLSFRLSMDSSMRKILR